MRASTLALFVCLPLLSCASPADRDGAAPARPALRMPPPTEHRLADDAESEHKSRRKQWMRERHRAGPDVDVAAVERANGERERVKRNALASMQAAVASRWTERGSRNQAGRMHVAALAPDGTSLYAGSSKGGVWHGTLDGQDWQPLGDNIYGGAHWLAVVSGAGPSGPDVIVRATDGGEVHRTTDSGATWTAPAGLPSFQSVRRVLVTSDGSETIFLLGRYWDGGSYKNTLYRSTDRGASFQFSNGLSTWEGDVWTSRTGGGALYVIKLDKLQVSVDNGSSWNDVGPLPVTAFGAELTGSEAGAPRLWAVLDTSTGRKLYRSDDAGGSWTFKHDVTDYWGSLNASITNPDLFAWGGVEVWRTTDGGDVFTKVNGWGEYYGDPAGKLHADIPGIDVVPAPGGGGEIWYVSTDGGLYRSTTGLASVENLSLDGLRVSQYYSTLTSVADPDHVAAGAQDQGYQWAGDPPSGGTLIDFDQLISGDYGHLTSGDGTHAYVYSTYPGFVLIQKGETNPALYTTDFPPTENNWLPSVVADPALNTRFFFPARELYRYTKGGGNTWSWAAWSTQDFGISNGEFLTEMVFSPVNTLRTYAVSNTGRMWRSFNHGLDWFEADDTGPGGQYFYGAALLASALDVDTVYVGGSGYSNPAVWHSTDGGNTYEPWGQGLPPTLVYCLAEAPDGSGTLYCGTETGAYERKPGAAAWVDITSNDAPVTTYWSAEAVPALNVIRFGTYRRGIWDYDVDDGCVYAVYGAGLGGANTITLDSASSTHMGGTHTLEVSGAPPLANGYLLYSPFTTSLPLYGGTLLVDPGVLIFLPLASDGAGAATLPLNIPSDPLAVGLPLNFQAALPDGPGFDDWAFSNGLQGVICE